MSKIKSSPAQNSQIAPPSFRRPEAKVTPHLLDPACPPALSPPPSPTTYPLHTALQTHRHSSAPRHAPASGPLHVQFPLLELSFPRVCMWVCGCPHTAFCSNDTLWGDTSPDLPLPQPPVSTLIHVPFPVPFFPVAFHAPHRLPQPSEAEAARGQGLRCGLCSLPCA